MKNILVTAGGTSEPIDNVRYISNTGTGRLGSLVAEKFAKEDSVERIFYICAQNTIKPTSHKVTILEVQSVTDLQETVFDIMENNKIDAVIHSMAVSDYRVKSVIDLESFSQSILDMLLEQNLLLENVKASILKALDSNNIIENTGKLSSHIDAPMILLEQTPKVIPMFKKLAPDAIVVGFKLLSKVLKTELLEVAHKLLIANSCDYVLANDASQIVGDQHKAYLLDKDKVISSFSTKQEIAAGIVSAVMERK